MNQRSWGGGEGGIWVTGERLHTRIQEHVYSAEPLPGYSRLDWTTSSLKDADLSFHYVGWREQKTGKEDENMVSTRVVKDKPDTGGMGGPDSKASLSTSKKSRLLQNESVKKKSSIFAHRPNSWRKVLFLICCYDLFKHETHLSVK